jgi:hypothetical protein
MRAAQKEAEALIPGGNVIWFDDFLCADWSYGWGSGGENPRMQITVSDGVATIRTERYDEIWEGLSRTNSVLREGTGYLVLFRYEDGTTGNLALASGRWQTPSNRSWMLALKFEQRQWATWEGWEGTDWMSSPYPYSMLRADAWFYLQMHFEEGGRLSAKVWEKDRLENQAEFHRNFGSNWAELPWTTLFQVYEGAVSLDRYWEIKF